MHKVKSSIVASQLSKQSSIILSIPLGLSITPRLYSTFLAEVLRSSTDLCHLTFLVLLIQVSLFFNFNIKPQYQYLKELHTFIYLYKSFFKIFYKTKRDNSVSKYVSLFIRVQTKHHFCFEASVNKSNLIAGYDS